MVRGFITAWVLMSHLVALTGCSQYALSDPEWDMPVRYSISVSAPKHYDVWVDALMMESFSENRGWRAPIGIVSCCWKDRGKVAEWQTMPELFVVRWFSFAEQQAYLAVIKLEDPDKLFAKMQEPAPITHNGRVINMPRDTLVIGLAPGGQVVIWIMNWAETAIEVGRYQAQPYNHKERGEDYTRRTQNYLERSGAYLKEHGIRYEGW